MYGFHLMLTSSLEVDTVMIPTLQMRNLYKVMQVK